MTADVQLRAVTMDVQPRAAILLHPADVTTDVQHRAATVDVLLPAATRVHLVDVILAMVPKIEIKFILFSLVRCHFSSCA